MVKKGCRVRGKERKCSNLQESLSITFKWQHPYTHFRLPCCFITHIWGKPGSLQLLSALPLAVLKDGSHKAKGFPPVGMSPVQKKRINIKAVQINF